MVSNSNNQSRAIGGPSPMGNPEIASPAANQPFHLRPPSLPQASGGSLFQGLFKTLPPVPGPLPIPSPARLPDPECHARRRQSLLPFLLHPRHVVRQKAPPQKPPPCPPTPVPAIATPSFKSVELTPAARRKKCKPESALYTRLLEFEARVNAALARKKIDIQEALKNPPSMQRTLRIYVFNTFANRTCTIPESKFSSFFRVCLDGREWRGGEGKGGERS